MSSKNYFWDVYRWVGGEWVYRTSFKSGATRKSAFNDFNAYISEGLGDGKYACQRRIADAQGKYLTIYTESWR
jgi:hypothetical protein